MASSLSSNASSPIFIAGPPTSRQAHLPSIYGFAIRLRVSSYLPSPGARREDVEPIQRWIGNEEITKYLGFLMFPQSLEETTAFVERQLVKEGTPDEGVFVISLRDDPGLEYMGTVGFHGISWRDRHCELGIVMGREDLLGQGLGTEAIRLALGFAFNFLNMHKVNLTVFEYNERGYRCYIKCGFKEEGRIREQRFYNGRYWDVIMMGITREEFAAVAHSESYCVERS